MHKKMQSAAKVLIIVLGLYILYRGFTIVKENPLLQKIPGVSGLARSLETIAVKTHMPALAFAWQGTGYPKEWTDFVMDGIFPLYSYAKEEAEELPDIESRLEYELMMELESPTEELADAPKGGAGQGEGTQAGSAQGEEGMEGAQGESQDGNGAEAAQRESQDGNGAETAQGESRDGSGAEAAQGESRDGNRAETAQGESQGGSGTEAAQGESQDGSGTEAAQDGEKAGNGTEGESEFAAKEPGRESVTAIDENELRDYNYLLNNFFAVDPSTTPLESQINYDAFMDKDLKLTTDASQPQILIYHTHSQEAFIDSAEGDVNDTIVGIGNRLTEILTDTYGYNVIHHTEVYDLIDGVLDRNMAYTLAAPDIQQILDENPSIEVVIDLHRDGVDGYKFVTEIDGKPTAKIMFYNGLSRSAQNGEIAYLPNPYIGDNLAFSFQLQLKAAEYYPGWMRNIYLSSLRYNLHMRPRSLLIEAGTQLNTVQEELNAMEPLADILNQVLCGA